MANAIFAARLTLNSSTTVNSTDFDINADILDSTGNFLATNVSVGDAVFLDTLGSNSGPGTISAYEVIHINTPPPNQFLSCNIRIRYIDTGTPVDPNEVLGAFGIVCARSACASLSYLPAADLNQFPQYLVEYARDFDMQTICPSGSGSGNSNLTYTEQVTLQLFGVTGVTGLAFKIQNNLTKLPTQG